VLEKRVENKSATKILMGSKNVLPQGHRGTVKKVNAQFFPSIKSAKINL